MMRDGRFKQDLDKKLTFTKKKKLNLNLKN